MEASLIILGHILQVVIGGLYVFDCYHKIIYNKYVPSVLFWVERR